MYIELAGGVLCCVASFSLFVDQRELFQVPRPAASAAEMPAVVELEWSSSRAPSQIDHWRSITHERSIDARARTLSGDWSWLDTAAQLQDPYFIAEARRDCDTQYGGSISGRCWFSFHYVLEHEADELGHVIYVKATLRDQQSIPPAEEANDPHCHSYVGCLARARLGAAIPLPPTAQSEVAIHEHMQASWGLPTLYDPKRLPALIASWAKSRDSMARKRAKGDVTVTTEAALKQRFITALVPYLREHLQRIRDARDHQAAR